MAKKLSDWFSELHKQFDVDELDKDVVRAKITIGLTDPKTGEIQYHSVEYTAKSQVPIQMILKQI